MSEFMWGFLTAAVLFSVVYYLDTRAWRRSHKRLSDKQDAINRRLDALDDPLGH